MIYQVVNILLRKDIRFKTSMIRSDLCGYNDANIIEKGTITIKEDNDPNKRKKKVKLQK